MEILSNKYPGRLIICTNCGAVLANIQESDIYAENIVYCPLCKAANSIEYNKNYNGVVKNNVENNSDN